MSLIQPFRGLRPRPEDAADVLAPPYDVLDVREARARAAAKPWSFLHVSKPEIDLPEDTPPGDDRIYLRGRQNLEALIAANVLRRDPRPCYYVYRLASASHTQTGLAALVSVDAYDHGRILKHEHTLPSKEEDRARHIETVNAQTGPALLAHRDSPEIAALLRDVSEVEPEVDVVADDGVRHSIWMIAGDDRLAALSTAVDRLDRLYIADGHHRSAAASRVARARGGPDGASHRYFLSVLFPQSALRILDYNRILRDLNGLSTEAFIARLRESCTVESAHGPVTPGRSGEFGIYLAGHWLRAQFHERLIPRAALIASLDVSLLTAHILQPVLGISDLRRDPRIDFVGGVRGTAELERRVDNGEMAVAFRLFPTTMDQLMAVADAGEVMPPKSTWFEPKLADGLIAHVLD